LSSGAPNSVSRQIGAKPAAMKHCARPPHTKRRRRGLTGRRRSLSDMLRAHWRFSLTRYVRDAARNDGRR
jgi:hypothetical protein